MLPMTIVEGASTIEECGFFVKSTETSGVSHTSRIPFNSPKAASIKALFISSAFVSLESSQTRSTTETVGVGTRIAMPFSFPFSSGKTSPTADAAPVVVGIIDKAAERALLKSLCGASSSLWSEV